MTLPVLYAYPGCRWELPPGRHKALMEALSAHTHIYFVNWPEFRGAYTEVLRPRAERIAPNITLVHNAFGLRFARGGKRLGRAAAMIDGLWLKDLLRDQGVRRYVYWIAAVCRPLLWGMRTDRLIFDCIDPCFENHAREHFNREEAVFARRAKVVFATAESLAEKMHTFNPDTYLLPNGCNEAQYHPDVLARCPRPTELTGVKGPIIGYMGTFDARVDTQTLTDAARRAPDLTFALVGRVNQDQEARVRELRALPNVIMPGAVSLEAGFAWTAATDVGIIPFLPGDMGDAINPVKMHMYLMAGKPVVSTWLRECRRHGPEVLATRNTDEFVAALRRAAADLSAAATARRVTFARLHTWAERAKEASEILHRHGLLSERPVGAVCPA